MGQNIKRRYCPQCQGYVLALQQTPNHILHLLLTLVTGGFWIVIWLIAALGTGKPLCQTCGSKTKAYAPR